MAIHSHPRILLPSPDPPLEIRTRDQTPVKGGSRLHLLSATLIGLSLLHSATAGDWPMGRHDPQRSSVTDETVTFPLRPSWIYRAAQTPRPAWPEPVKNLNRLDFDYAPQPVIADGMVCFGSSADDTVRALDAKTGGLKWQFTSGGPVRFAPQIAAGKVYFGSDDGLVYCLDAASGNPLWSFRGGPQDDDLLGNGRMISRWPVRTGVLVMDGAVYFAAGMWPSEGVFVYALDATTGKPIWCNDTSGARPVVVVGHARDPALSGITPQGAILASGDRLVLPMGRSAPAFFDRKTGDLLAFGPGWMNGTGGSWATIDGGRCYLFSKSFYSGLAISGISLDRFELGAGGGGLPQNSTFCGARQYSTYEGKVSAIVKNGVLTGRLAYGLARADKALFIGQENTVLAEGSEVMASAQLRFGITGDKLAVHAMVVDRNITIDPVPWKGSCVEIFGCLPGKPRIGQVFLTPQTAGAPARAFRSQNGAPVAVDEIRVQTTAIANGYELQALIPLALLALDPSAGEFTLEAQVTATSADGKLHRGTMFGSDSPYQNNKKFGRFAVGTATLPAAATSERQALAKLPLIDSLEKLKGLLTEEKPLTVQINNEGKLWSATVQGKACEIAIADGRVFVSTDTGEITCFESAAAAGGTEPTLHAETSAVAPGGASKPDAEILVKLQTAGMEQGYALVLGDSNAELSGQIVAQTRLHVINIMPDAGSAAALRAKLLATTRWYGSRIHVLTVQKLEQLPFPRYFANAVILEGNVPGVSGKELYRVLRPCGGIMLLRGLAEGAATALLKDAGIPGEELHPSVGITIAVRGRLEGAWDWDSKLPGDKLVKWPLRPSWFGGTSPAKTHNRKWQGPTLTTANGLIFENNAADIVAVDAYNGTEWWSRRKPFQGDQTYGSSISADAENVYLGLNAACFHTLGGGCILLDPRTGAQKKIYAPYQPPPQVALTEAQTWKLGSETNAVGAVSMTTDADGLALTLTSRPPPAKRSVEWLVYLDFRPQESRFGLYETGTYQFRLFPSGSANAPATWKPGTGTGHPRLAVAGAHDEKGTSTSVKLAWADVPGLSGKAPPSFGFGVSRVLSDPTGGGLPVQTHLFCDAVADGLNNGWANIILAPSPAGGILPKPKIIAGMIETEPPAPGGTGAEKSAPTSSAEALERKKFQQRTQRMDQSWTREPRIHPLAGHSEEWFMLAGDGCSMANYSAVCALHRAANAGIYDFQDDSGVRTFGGVRLSCGTSSIAANGVWFIANGGSGCECTYAFLSEVGLVPSDRRLNEDWALYGDWAVDTRVRQAHINLGAPGDRRDESRALWLGFPRTTPHRSGTQFPQGGWTQINGLWQQKVPLAMEVPLEIETFEGLGPRRINADRVTIEGTDRPWIYASQYRGIRKAVMKLNFLKPIVAKLAAQPVAIDGKLDDPVWNTEPQATLPVTKSTIQMSYDTENLYFAFKRPTAFDRQGKNRPWQLRGSGYMSDYWELFLSDVKNEKILHLFQSAGGSRLHGIKTGATPENQKAALVWTGAATAGDPGFVAEFALPWKSLADAGIDRESLTLNAQVGDHPNVAESIVRLGGKGREHCENFVPLGLDKIPVMKPRLFTVRLHFAEMDEVKPGRRIFDVKLQGETVLKNFDVVQAAGGVRKAVVKEFQHVTAGEALALEFIPAVTEATPDTVPILNGLELYDEEFQAKLTPSRPSHQAR